ncbi:MAG: dehydrogenase/acetyl-CoA synthase, partial [Deltaproteobacteria bacterium]|nr:dehydrogenase/acetyl-CoA synthase [Deltaproteobacteria bacterium]
MSKIIASAAIRGAHKIYNMVEAKYKEVLDKYGPNQEIGFPNTAYYLPIIYAMTGISVSKLEDCDRILKLCKKMIP